MQFNRSSIREGMTVYSLDGEKLGTVLSCDASRFVIEKGFFFPKDYVARYDDVTSVDGDDIHLSLSKDTFQQLRESGSESEGWSAGGISTSGRPATTEADVLATDYGMDRSDLSRTARTGATGEDVRVPIAEEELDVVKRDRQAGEVRLRKDVVTETKHIEVPVTREEVHVDRVPATNRDATGENLFQKDSVSVPIHEEEIEVRKRPVVKEEVRLRKERFTEQRAADADVRKERVDVEGDEGSRRIDRTDDFGTNRRLVDDDTTETRRTINDPLTGLPPRDDT